MHKLFCVAALGLGLLAGTGCHHSRGMHDEARWKSQATTDDCPHCAGVQHANADGPCPVCGMKVKPGS